MEWVIFASIFILICGAAFISDWIDPGITSNDPDVP
jgi:hypothetical protein